jgi:hypothetical protein
MQQWNMRQRLRGATMSQEGEDIQKDLTKNMELEVVKQIELPLDWGK